jgi:hypothetical protein
VNDEQIMREIAYLDPQPATSNAIAVDEFGADGTFISLRAFEQQCAYYEKALADRQSRLSKSGWIMLVLCFVCYSIGALAGKL